MRHLVKWFCIALLVVTVMRPPGLDAASHRGPTRKKHLKKGANKNNIKYYKIPNSDLDERNGPGTSSQVYSAVSPWGSPDTVDEVVSFLASVYNFMESLTENYFPGSEFVNKFWRLLLYFINKKLPFVESIVNPTTIFNNILYELLKRQELVSVDDKVEEQTPYDEQYTRIEYNPFKQLIVKFLYVFGEFFGFNPIDVWWSKISKIYNGFSLFTEETIDAQTLQYQVKDQDIGTTLGLGAVLTPLSHLAVYKVNPIVFAVNVFLIIVWQLVFLDLYAPSIADSIFGDDSDDGSGDGEEEGSGEGGDEGANDGMDDENTEEGAPDMENMEGEDDAPDPPSTDMEPPPEEDESGDDEPPPDPPADDLVPPPEEGEEGQDAAPDPPADDLVPPPEEGEEGQDADPNPPPEDSVQPPEEGDTGAGEDVAPDPPAEDLVPPPPPPPPPEEGDTGGNTENEGRKDYYYYSDEYYDYEYKNDDNEDHYYYY